MPSNSSFTSACNDNSRTEIWGIRVLLAVTLLSLILAQTVFKSSTGHDFCIGFGIGTLGAALVASFMMKGLAFRRNSGRGSDVDSISVMR